MGKCKYFTSGLCYSPHAIKTFGEPSGEPVDFSVCLSDRFRGCRYYAETSVSSDAPELYEAMGLRVSADYYLPVHAVACDQNSECPFYRVVVVDGEGGVCVSQCTISDRYLTKASVKKCVISWRDCPFYKVGLEVIS